MRLDRMTLVGPLLRCDRCNHIAKQHQKWRELPDWSCKVKACPCDGFVPVKR